MAKRVEECRKCGASAPHYVDGSKARGVSSYCVDCTKAARKKHYETSKSASAEATRRWVAKNPEKVRATKAKNRLKNYGVTACQFTAQRIEQMDRCVLCSNDISDDPVVDHCHETGAVRGLLCRHCNFALGHVKDDVNVLANAISYLETGGAWRR